MGKCFYGYSQNTTGPAYCPNSTLCNGEDDDNGDGNGDDNDHDNDDDHDDGNDDDHLK